jgi:hypothetical protein
MVVPICGIDLHFELVGAGEPPLLWLQGGVAGMLRSRGYACRSAILRMAIIIAAEPSVRTSVGCCA